MFFPPNSSMMYKTSQVVKYKTLKFEPRQTLKFEPRQTLNAKILKFEPRQTLKMNALEHDENAQEYDAQCLVAIYLADRRKYSLLYFQVVG
jgi:hypothetical protein